LFLNPGRKARWSGNQGAGAPASSRAGLSTSVFEKGSQIMKHATIFAGLLIAVLIFCQLPAFGQVGTGRLSSTVYDASGAVIPNAKVVLTSESTQTSRDTVSNNSGFFDFQAVQAGTYTVTVTAAGFTSWEGKGIVITQGASATLPNITLNVRGTKTEVTVVSASEMIVPVDTGQSSTTLNTQMISQVSIAGRDAAELIKIMPGMGFTNGLSQGSSFNPTNGTANNSGPIGMYSANGTQPFGAMTMTNDGANLLDPGNQGTQVANINADQTAEVTLLTSAYGAEFAKGPVTFQAIGKSGGSQFHGSGYFYARNGVFNSTDSYLKSQGVAKPDDHYYYPGGDIGGPVLIPGTGFNKNRDKLFFYAGFEVMRQQQAGYLKNYFLPTADMMGQNPAKAYGDFTPQYLGWSDSNGTKHAGVLGSNFMNAYGTGWSAPCGNTYDASGNVLTNGGCNGASNNEGGVIGNGSGVVYPGGKIPLSMIDPSSLNYWKTYPSPNANSANNSAGANYQVLINPPQNRWELKLRGDYNISDNTKLFFSWNRQDETDQNPINIWWTTPGALPYPSALTAYQESQVYSANLTHVFSPTLTNEFVFADAKFVNPINLGNPSAVDPATVGFKLTGLFTDPYKPQIPNVLTWDGAVAGYGAYTMGITGYVADFGKTSNAPNISDNISKVWGTHTVKAGFYWDFNQNDQTGGDQTNASQGTLTYYNYQGQSTGNEIADFVTGRAGLNQTNNFPTENFKYYQYSFYVQDSWKASRRLTLTYGLRMDHMGQWFPNSGPGLAVWDWATYNNNPATAPAYTGFLDHTQSSSIPVSGFPSKSFFPEPRVGAAYDLFGNGKTVLRGGFGEYRYQLAYNSVSGASYTAPLGYITEGSTWGCCIGYTSFNNYSPSLGAAGLGSGPSKVLTEGDSRTPHSYTYNFTISQRVPFNSVAEFEYSGNKSKDMMLDSGGLGNVDLVPVGAFFRADPLTGVVNNPASSNFPTNDYYPLRNYTSLQTVTHGSYSNYNAFIATWQKQTGRVTYTMNYTFSKVLGIRDNETDNGAGQGSAVDPYTMANNYGVLGFDHTHIFNAAYVINLPSPIHGNAIAGGVVNGWELSGITQLQSGAPIQPNTAGNLNVQWPSSYSQQQDLGTNGYPNGVIPQVICDPRDGLSSGQYFNPACFAPPPKGQQGTLVWPYIKGPGYFNSDLSLYKNFNFKEHQQIQFRMQTYNFLNHPLEQFNADGNSTDIKLNFNNNNTLSQTNINALTTGTPLHTVGRRVVMFSVKYVF